MEYAEFTGKSTEEALLRAQEHFALPLDRLQVEVVHAGSSGLFGLFGAKKAVVRVRPLPDSAGDQLAEMMADLSGASRPAPTVAPVAPPVQVAATVRQPIAQPTPIAGPIAATSVVSAQEAIDIADAAEDDMAGDFDDDEDAPAPAGQEERLEDETVVADAKAVLERLVTALDDAAGVSAQNTTQGVVLEISGDEAGMLIGRRGQTLEALQYLTTRIVSHQQGRPVRVHVDAGGYRRRRRQSLEELALRLAEKAKGTGRPVSLGPICAQERRVVHMILRAEPGISTISRGRGELKKVVISPRR